MRNGWMGVVLLLAGTAYAEPESKAERIWKDSGHMVVYDLYPLTQQVLTSDWWARNIDKSPLGAELNGKVLARQLPTVAPFIPKKITVRLARNALAELIRFGHLLELFNLMTVDFDSENELREFERARDEFRGVLKTLGTCRVRIALEMRDKRSASNAMMLVRMLTRQLAMEFEAPMQPVRDGFVFDFNIGSDLFENWLEILDVEGKPSVKEDLKRFRFAFRVVQREDKLLLDVGPPDDIVDPPALTLERGKQIVQWDADLTPARAALRTIRKSLDGWSKTDIGRKLAAEDPPVDRADEFTEAELDELDILLTQGSGSVEAVPYGIVTRLTWKERGRLPSLDALPVARYLAQGGLFSWSMSEPLPRLIRTNYAAVESRLYLRTMMRDREAIHREFLERFGDAGEAIAKLEGFGSGSSIIMDLRRTNVRIEGVERKLYIPEICLVGIVSDRKQAERSIAKIGGMLIGSKEPMAMQRDKSLELGDDAFGFEGTSAVHEAVTGFVPHVAFFGDVCVIGTSPVRTRALHAGAQSGKEMRMPWKPDLRPVEYARFDGKKLAGYANAVSEWMSLISGTQANTTTTRMARHVLALLDSAEYWSTSDGETRKAGYRLRMIE
ncbi:MAG: hypothetical protein AAGD14_09185 [Planctomycetota bacterium]